jgi:multidrug efflux pump subunit AcrB
MTLLAGDGRPVPVSSLARIEETEQEPSRYHKNLKKVVYVVADVAETEESPVYAILKMNKALKDLKTPEGIEVRRSWSRVPEDESVPALKWNGEMQITIEVFRDLGLAFAAVLVLIYILVVGWFKSFSIPLVIMAPIPLTLVGILPGHAIFGAFFTATSMIGFIAGAGIIVRNSIILVDFARLRMKEGMKLDEAIIDAGAIRFRPMLLTAAAVVVGSFVILFDPIFQGLALALMFGEVASTLLSRITVPVLFYMSQKKYYVPGPLKAEGSRGGFGKASPSGVSR